MKIVKFLISGGLAALLEYSIFIALTYLLGVNWLIISQTVSFLAGSILSFSLQKIWVFKSDSDIKSELVKYGLLAGINLALTNLMIVALVDVAGVNQLIAKIFIMAAVAIWNYLIFQKFIFRSSGRQV